MYILAIIFYPLGVLSSCAKENVKISETKYVHRTILSNVEDRELVEASIYLSGVTYLDFSLRMAAHLKFQLK